jgi:hypothetical protein
MNEQPNVFEKIIVSGALVVAIWYLIPAFAAILAAFCLMISYGFTAFNLPSWAVGIGSGCMLFVLVILSFCQKKIRSELFELVIFYSKLGGILLLMSGGAMMAIEQLDTFGSVSPKLLVLENASTDALFSLTNFYAWVAIVGFPSLVAITSLMIVLSETPKPQKIG